MAGTCQRPRGFGPIARLTARLAAALALLTTLPGIAGSAEPIPSAAAAIAPTPPALDARPDGGAIVVAEPSLREVTLTGFTRARARLPLVAETAGRVVAVGHDIGGGIGADGDFARIDDTFIRLEIDENAVRQERLRAQIAYAEREVERYTRLAQENNTARSQLDQVEQTLRDNRHELRGLAVQQRVLAERLVRTRINAPAGWRVTARAIEPGQWVAAGERVGEVADLGTLVLPFALTPEQYAALTARAAAGGLTVTLPDLGRDIAASVLRTNPDFDPETRKIAVELRLDGPVEPRRGGLRALLALPLPEQSGAVLLPAAAVRKSFEEHWVEPVQGEPVQVVVLGEVTGPDGPRLRVSSPALVAGTPVRLPAAR